MSLIRDKHVKLYRVITLYFPILYLITGIAPTIGIYTSIWNFDLISSVIFAFAIFSCHMISRYYRKSNVDLSNKITEYATVIGSFLVPLHMIAIMAFTVVKSPDQTYVNLIVYYLSVFVSVMTLYSKKLIALFYIKNFVASFLVGYIVKGNEATVVDIVLPPMFVLSIGAIQSITLNYFKIAIINELETEKVKVEDAEKRQKEKAEDFETFTKAGFGGVAVIDRNLTVIYINDYLLEKEYARHNVLGKHISELLQKISVTDTRGRYVVNEIRTFFDLNHSKTVHTVIKIGNMSNIIFFTPILKDGIVVNIIINFREAFRIDFTK